MIVTVATTKELSFLRLSARSSLPNALAGIQQVVSAKFLGVTFCQSLKLGDHVKNILTTCGLNAVTCSSVSKVKNPSQGTQ